ncbi:MAG: hypothetical protein AAF993_11560 [Pseudomonadota bacterium]
MDREQPRAAHNQHHDAVDLLEIYHARQMRDQIIGQLRRIRASNEGMPINHGMHKREIRGYYEALLLTVVELLHRMGDDDLPG